MAIDPKGTPKAPAKASSKLHEMSRIPGVTPGAVGAVPDADAKGTIRDFDKTGIYQQIVAADSEKDVEHLENRIQLIEAIQRVQLLQTLPETALYFLEHELKFHVFQPKDMVRKIDKRDHFANMFLIVEGQVMVLGEEGPGRTRVVNILKKGEFFFDKQFRWAGLNATEVHAIMPTQILQLEANTLTKIVKVSAGVRKRLKAISLRMDKRAEKFDGAVGRIWNYLVRHGYSYSERVRVIRIDKCIECDSCYKGCEDRHGHARIWKSKNKFGLLMFPDACRTCEFTHCTAHCPGDHIYFDPIYREVIVKDTCTGCTHCAEDCPYGVIKMVERADGSLAAEVDADEVDGTGRAKGKGKKETPKSDKAKQIAIKCDHCFGHEDMACVTPCPTGAIFDLSQRELFERVDLYGVAGNIDIEEAGRTLRPVIYDEKPGDRGGLHAFLWSFALMSAAILGYESWARGSNVEWSLSYLGARAVGYAGEIRPIDAKEGLGRWLGWVGSTMLTLTLMYVPRKRLEGLFKSKARATWLDVHVFLGLMGFIFALYHTTFHVTRGLWMIPFWSCALVVLTGLIGRYFHGQLPRTVAGNEMKLEDAKAEVFGIEQEMQRLFPDSTAYKAFLDWSLPESAAKYGLIRTVILMIVLDLKRNAKLAGLKSRLVGAGQARSDAATIVKVIKRKANLEQKIILYEKSKRISKVWLAVHIFAAILMFVLLSWHIYEGIKWSGWGFEETWI